MNKIPKETIEKIKKEINAQPKIEKGWVDIEEHLPHCKAIDFITQGCSTYKVKDKNGEEFYTQVTDHNIWYYMAKEAGITHWLNE